MHRRPLAATRGAIRTPILLALAFALAASTVAIQAVRPAVSRAGVPVECTLLLADERLQATVDQTTVVADETFYILGSGWLPDTELYSQLYDVKFDEVYEGTLLTDSVGEINEGVFFSEGSQGEWIISAYQDSPACEAHANLRVLPLNDILESRFLYDIKWLFVEGITAGCSSDAFCPNGLVTRGQMATFLVRALNLPSTSTDYFSDDAGSVHESNINRLRAAGITAGCSPSNFCPSGLVTRAQMATFLARAFGLPTTSTDYFSDDTGSVHEPNINRVAAAGITHGCSDSRYCPAGIVTRGQMAAFLHRASD